MPDPIDLKLNIAVTGKLPGEDLLSELLKHDIAVRESMSKENRDRWDNLWLTTVEDLQHVWRGLWQMWGVIK